MWELVQKILIAFGDYAWGYPLLILLVGGGIFLTFYSRLIPYRYFGHAINVIRGKYDNPDEPGDVNHFEALSSALAATIGMGNISGVAIAIAMGGPGVIFWMWVSAFIGMATKFFTCTLAVMYRGKDSEGHLQGGPMYVIREGLSKSWRPLAVLFAVAGLFGMSPAFQANQLVHVTRDVLLVKNGLVGETSFMADLIIGLLLAVLVALVIFGGIKRIGYVAGKLVPGMVLIYLLSVLYILAINYDSILSCFALIFKDAFTADAVLGGAVGAIIIAGVRRAAFSNEAGIGSAPMAHGAAKTNEPVREGLVAMLGPAIDTLVICTLTALAILVTGAWEDNSLNGVALTLEAFKLAMPTAGAYILLLCVFVFAITTLFTYSYYGTKCLSYLSTVKFGKYFNYFYILSLIIGSVSSLGVIVNLIDGMYAMMAIPTMISTLLLAPKVMKAAKDYFQRHAEEEKKDNEIKRIFEVAK